MTDEIKKRIEQVKNGEVPKGYVVHRKYIFPENWRVMKMGEITKRVSIKNKGMEELPSYSINNQTGFVPQNEQFESSYANLDKSAYKMVKRGQFAYNPARINVGSIGLLKDVDKAIVSSLYVCFALSKKQNEVYFENWFKTYDFFKEIIRNLEGSVRQYLFYENFSNIDMLLPPTAEQEKIAEILIQCDKIIKLKKQLITEERKQKKWLIQNLLNPDSGVRLDGFDCEWKEKTMGELFKFGSSLSASREQLGETGICYLHYGDIHSNTSGVVDAQRDFDSIPKLLTDSISPNVLLNDGDVVFVDASEDYEGASKYIVVKNENAIPFIAGLHTIAAKSINEELILDYKRYCFQSYSVKNQISFYISGMKVFGLSKMNIAKIALKYPCTDEQAAIANIISTVDRKIELLEQELEQWQQKKKALMQLLLKGIVRVKL